MSSPFLALAIDLHDDGPPPVFLLGGSLDVGTRVRLREILLPELRDGRDGLVLDLTWLTYLDGAGLDAIVGLAAAARGPVVIRSAHGIPGLVIEQALPLTTAPNLFIEPTPGRPVDAPVPAAGPLPSRRRRPRSSPATRHRTRTGSLAADIPIRKTRPA